jgi:hypothetical protein
MSLLPPLSSPRPLPRSSPTPPLSVVPSSLLAQAELAQSFLLLLLLLLPPSPPRPLPRPSPTSPPLVDLDLEAPRPPQKGHGPWSTAQNPITSRVCGVLVLGRTLIMDCKSYFFTRIFKASEHSSPEHLNHARATLSVLHHLHPFHVTNELQPVLMNLAETCLSLLIPDIVASD